MKSWTGVQARLVRGVGQDQVEEIDYRQHTFTRYTHVVSGPGQHAKMDRNALNELAKELASEIASPPAGADLPGLKAFLDLIQESLPQNT